MSKLSFPLRSLHLIPSRTSLSALPNRKCLINTVNAHSFNVAQKDAEFAKALLEGDVLIPDGMSIVKACQWLGCEDAPTERVAGWDLFVFEMERLNEAGGKCFFLGSSEQTLKLIRERAKKDYPNIEVLTYSPPYKPEFSNEDNAAMISAVNSAKPDLLWIGMTAPKQEKWAFAHWDELQFDGHCGTIGAVFDFYAGTVRRAPLWWQRHGVEWLYRLLREPRRMWRRYIVGNVVFLHNIYKEKRARE